MGHLQQTQHIDLQDAGVLGQLDTLEMAEAQHSGAVEQQPQLPAVLSGKILQRRLHCCRIGHIQLGMPDPAQFSGQAGQRRMINV